jgi:hypothetical protein
MRLIAPFLTASLLAAVATTVLAPAANAQDATPVAPAATAPDATPAAPAAPAGHIPPPPPGKSQVVFFRTGAFYGAAVWIKVRESGQELGKLSNQAYFVTVLEPGHHEFTSAYELQDKIKMELDPGETYYVRGTLQSGLLLVGANLALVDAATFEKHYAHMHLVKSVSDDGAKAAK